MATKNVKGVKRADGNTYLYVDQAARTKIGTATLTTTAQDLSGAVNELKSGKADLDSGGKIPAAQLPSYVDDVLEYANKASFPATGEAGKIYIDKATNKTYRWSGTAYVEISESLALGETSSTAYAGNKGKANADAIAVLNGTGAGSVKKAVSDAIATLDVSSVGGTGRYISAISEADGKISATSRGIDNIPIAGSPDPVKSGGVFNAIENSVSLKSATGNPITLTDAANANAEELSMTFEPIQDLHGYSKPWPAGGGKNLFDVNTSPVSVSSVSLETNPSLGQIKVIATSTSGWQQVMIPLSLNNGTYTISITGETTSSPFSGGQRFVLYNATAQTGLNLDSDNKLTFTVNNNSWQLLLRLNQTTNASVGQYAVWSGIQLEVGSSATSYEPYSNICPISGLTSGEVKTTDGTDTNTATITFGQTVYGGSVNFKTGEVTVTHGIVDLGTRDWTQTKTTGLFYGGETTDGATSSIDYKCSNYPRYDGALANMPDKTFRDAGATTKIYIKDTRYTDAAAFKTAMSGVQLCYELATPTTLTLTPAELELLKGNNTITANGAEISLSYYPDNAIGALAGRVDDLDNTTSDMQTQIDKKVPICKATVDLSSLDQDTYYPVTGTAISRANNLATPKRICVNVVLNSGTKPSWSTHDDGFSVTLDVLVQGSSWGAQRAISHILIDAFSSVSGNISPCAYTQMTNSSTPVIWCRGGGKYFIYTDYDSDWTVRTSTYAINGQSVSPTTTKPANDMISANGYFGGISEAAYHVIDSNNSRSLDIRWGGPDLRTAAHIAAFSTNGLEIAPMSLATLGSLLNLNNKVEIQNNAGFHNSIYRGKYLGSEVTAEQYAAIAAGTFDDMYIGDYWTIDGVNYRIAAFDYWLHCGDRECTTHHVVLVPDTNLDIQKMNDSNVTTGGYVGSKMYTSYITTARNKVISAFGSTNILSHRQLFSNAVSGNYASNWAWYDSTIDLMSESMVYGAPIGGKAKVDSINFNIGIDKVQLPLFALDPSRITNRADWWLRDVVSAANFANVRSGGYALSGSANLSFGVRPVFAIKA